MPTKTINDVEMFYDTDGAGEPVVILSGLSADHRSCGFFFRAVAEHFHAVRYDHRGIGQSSRGTSPISARTLADDLLGLMDALDLERAHLVGVSMGGPVAIHLATQHPHRVRSLTLAVTTPKIDAAHKPLFRDLRQRLVSDGVEAFARGVVPLCFSESFRRDRPADIERIVKSLVERESPPETIVEQIDGCLETDVTDLLPRIGCPTLVLEAGRDEMIDPSAARTAAAIPNARAVTIEGSGHDIFVERPDQTFREILAFLQERS